MPIRRNAAGIIAGNDDILMEILLYMPAKSLMKFKSVSKHWLSLLSSFHFSRRHALIHRSTTTTSAIFLKKPQSNHCLISLRPDKNTPKVQTFTSKFINPTSKILQSCNGLLLLQVGCSSTNDNNIALNSEYYIYNPSTNQSRFLAIKTQSRLLGLCLGYDPSKSVTRYKVISMKVATFPRYEIEVYDSENRSWKAANGGKGVVMPRDIKLCNGIYWNGNIHWIRPKGKIFCFDLDKDCVVDCPGIDIQRSGPWDMWRNSGRIGNSNGHLYFITLCRSLISSQELVELQIFEMGKNDYSKGWFLKYKVNFDDILCEFPWIMEVSNSMSKWDALDSCDFCVVGMVWGEKDEELLLVFHVLGKVVGYKFKDESFVELLADFKEDCFYEEACFQFGGYDAYEFIETLAPV